MMIGGVGTKTALTRAGGDSEDVKNLVRTLGPDTVGYDHSDIAVAVLAISEVSAVSAGTAASDTVSLAAGTLGLIRRADLMTVVADSSVVASLHYLAARMR